MYNIAYYIYHEFIRHTSSPLLPFPHHSPPHLHPPSSLPHHLASPRISQWPPCQTPSSAPSPPLCPTQSVKRPPDPLPQPPLAKLPRRLVAQPARHLIQLIIRHDGVFLQALLPTCTADASASQSHTGGGEKRNERRRNIQRALRPPGPALLQSLLFSLGFRFEVFLGDVFDDGIGVAG